MQFLLYLNMSHIWSCSCLKERGKKKRSELPWGNNVRLFMLSGHRSPITRWDVPKEEASFSMSYLSLLIKWQKAALVLGRFSSFRSVSMGQFLLSCIEFSFGARLEFFPTIQRTITRKGNNNYSNSGSSQRGLMEFQVPVWNKTCLTFRIRAQLGLIWNI